MEAIKGWLNQLNPKVYHTSGQSAIMTDEELHREARRAAARRGIQIVGSM